MKKTVLIVGINSFVGSNLAEILRDEFRVVGTYHKTPVEIPGITCFPCDTMKKDYVMNIISRIKPDFTVYAAGMSSLMECKLRPKYADALNAGGAINVCTASERYGSRFILISSCYVLGGSNISYKEGDTPFPNTQYGASLSSAEFYVQRSCLNYLILRCSTLYGRGFNPKHPNWFESMQAAFVKGIPLVADDSVETGFLDIFILGRVLKAALLANVSNRLIHVSSKDSMNRFTFANLYAKIFHRDANVIQKTTGKFPIDTDNKSGGVAAQNYYFKMDVSNVEEFLGTKMPTIEDSLQFTHKRLQRHS